MLENAVESNVKSIYSNNSSHQLEILEITETHVKGKEAVYDAKIDGQTYKSFEGGVTGNNSYTGVASSINANLQPQFTRVNNRNDRIFVVKACTSQKYKLIVIVAYVPTMLVSVKLFHAEEDFYQEIHKLFAKGKNCKHFLILLGNFNANTGSGNHVYKENTERYGKGYMNRNGEHLLDTLPDSNTILTNTCFPHKLAHRTIIHVLYVVHVLHQIEILVMILIVNVG